MADDLEAAVVRHYGVGDLKDRILKAIAAAGVAARRKASNHFFDIAPRFLTSCFSLPLLDCVRPCAASGRASGALNRG